MKRCFIQTKQFSKQWDELGFKDDDLRRLELEILQNPKNGDVIPGTGRLRKMRFAYNNRGKSGSVRVCYVDFDRHATVYLIVVYAKANKENLSKEECNVLRSLIQTLEDSL